MSALPPKADIAERRCPIKNWPVLLFALRQIKQQTERANPLVRGQLQLDRMWQSRLDAREAGLRRIERPGHTDAASGVYDPLQRFESEF